MLLFPDEYARSVYSIDYKKLMNRGITKILFDVDNTLITYSEAKPNKKLIDLFNQLTEMGFEVFFVSNNTEQRIETFCDKLEFHRVSNSLKPFPFKIKKELSNANINKNNAVIIGDQLLTDVFASKTLGIRSILVVPISKRDKWYTKPSRQLEYFILKFDKRLSRYDFR